MMRYIFWKGSPTAILWSVLEVSLCQKGKTCETFDFSFYSHPKIPCMVLYESINFLPDNSTVSYLWEKLLWKGGNQRRLVSNCFRFPLSPPEGWHGVDPAASKRVHTLLHSPSCSRPAELETSGWVLLMDDVVLAGWQCWSVCWC